MQLRKTFLWFGFFASIAPATTPAHCSTLFFADGFDYVYNQTTGYQQFSQFQPNGTSATAGGSSAGITVSSSANLLSGVLRIFNQGDGSAGIDAASEAAIGDTITAHGSTGGLNLGVNIDVGGTITDTTYTNNNTFLIVDVLPVGAFDQSNYFSDILYSEIYTLGPNANPAYGWQSYGSFIDGNYPSGTNVIPLNIPFDNIGSNFQIFIALQSYEIGSAGVWTTDYTDPFTVSLAPPAGVTLDSSGGISGSIASAPEPAPPVLLLVALSLLAIMRPRSAE